MAARVRVGAFGWALALTAIVGTACAPSLKNAPPATSLYPEPSADAITFWGHSCAYIDVGGYRIVTDPVFSRTYAAIRHRLIPSPPEASFDQTRLILISHAHQDHLDPKTLKRFGTELEILAPPPSAEYLRKRGFRVRAMRPGDEYPFPGGSVTAVLAHHPGYRLSLKARADGRATGYVIRTKCATIYYTGDTDYFPGFASVGRSFHPDITLLNLNGHLHSEDAVAAIDDLGAPAVIPIHFGAYDGKSARLGPVWRSELIRRLGKVIVPLGVGESFKLSNVAACGG